MNYERQNKVRKDTHRLVQWSQVLQQEATTLRAETKATILAGQALRQNNIEPGREEGK